ncbi:hypothetical protein ACEWY4_027852 [Coilia grayii]|uniref:Helix-turn-helix domain-containing protein n=1 Tax=Coilia grayii TaxID=363190 RepID=A0ABD1INZ2_9TELE
MSLRRDIHLYHRRLKILDHFEYEDEYEREPFVEPSRWEPKVQAASAHIRALLEGDWMALEDFSPSAEGMNNITSEQRQAIKSLSRNQQLVIKPADKGGQIVMQDRCFYLQEAYRQLSDTTYYTPLSEPLQPSTQVEIRNCINDMYDRKIISSKQRFYLYGPEEPRMRQFYLLPKIHKSPDTWTIPHVLPKGRPIVSDCGSESYRIAEFIDFHINPLSQRHPSYVKDTYSFVDEVSALTVPRGSFLFTVDVDSLYTNIDTTLGLQALKDTFALYPDPLRPDSFILKLLEITLTKNDFEFNGKFYLQTCGCAMGRKYSPSYADIYLARWEEQAFRQCEKTPLIYKRYLDDLFGIWTHSEEDFNHFIQILNSQHPKIKLKQNLQPVCVEFLDTVVFQISTPEGASKLATRVYFKDTDRHALLHRRSFHPRHTFRGLIKAQLIRFHRICTYKKHVDEATAILFEALYPRGYSKRFLRTIKDDDEFHKATRTLFSVLRKRNYSRTFLRNILKNFLTKTSLVGNKKIIPFISTFSKNGVQLNRLIKSNFQKFLSNTHILQQHTVISAYRRNRNLKDLLVRSKLAPISTKQTNEKNKAFISKTWVTNYSTKEIFKIRQTLTPQTTNLIYLITCTKCTKQYVGQTKNTMLTRLYQHVYNIKHQKEINTHIVQHFTQHGLASLRISGLESNRFWSLFKRLQKERTWMTKLSTKYPNGLNEA